MSSNEKDNKQKMSDGEDKEEDKEEETVPQFIEIGHKTATGGWFVSAGELALLTHDDGSCSLHDIVNSEEKAEYRLPNEISQNIWRDCWIIRTTSGDGYPVKYVVAASAGNSMVSGFCSWDFDSKDVKAFHIEDDITKTRYALGLQDKGMHTRNLSSSVMSQEYRQWWYRPCGPLITATASCQRAVKLFDIRDGDQIMMWDVEKPVLAMDYCSPLQWRNGGNIVVAETDSISLSDVRSLSPKSLLSISTSGHQISALHVNNTDAEIGGGVRQRLSTVEAGGFDGVFCTVDGIGILDFRQSISIGVKIPNIGMSVESVSTRGDSIFLGCSRFIYDDQRQVQSKVLQLSVRMQKIVKIYNLQDCNSFSHHKAVTQVWGNSNLVIAESGKRLFVFDTKKDDGFPLFVYDNINPRNGTEVVDPYGSYSHSFDYRSSQILLVSRDRPAMWRQLS